MGGNAETTSGSIELAMVKQFANPVRNHSVIPGFRISLAITVIWLSLIVLIPMAVLVLQPFTMGWQRFIELLFNPRTLAAFRVSFGFALLAAFINVFLGLILAWVLVRVELPGKRFIDACVDLPFALPTAVAGIALTALLVPKGWVGQFLAPYGIVLAYQPWGILVAMIFIGLPFVVRSLEPVLIELERVEEEAAAILGATASQSFWRVTLPAIRPAILTGFSLAFARGVSEYGSIIFISGNLPGISEIVPLLIVVKLQQFDAAGAAAIGVMMLLTSFTILYLINWINNRLDYQHWTRTEQQVSPESAGSFDSFSLSGSHDLTAFRRDSTVNSHGIGNAKFSGAKIDKS